MTHIKRTPRESSFFSLFFCGHSDVLDKLDANSIEKYNLLFLSFIMYHFFSGTKCRSTMPPKLIKHQRHGLIWVQYLKWTSKLLKTHITKIYFNFQNYCESTRNKLEEKLLWGMHINESHMYLRHY